MDVKRLDRAFSKKILSINFPKEWRGIRVVKEAKTQLNV
jgi:hypothetical protein